MKYCNRKLLVDVPAIDQTLFTRTPITQSPGMVSATADAPSPQVSVEPTADDVAGKVKTGPTPQIRAPGLAGERKAVTLTPAIPKVVPPSVKLGCQTSGKMVRVMRFQSSPR